MSVVTHNMRKALRALQNAGGRLSFSDYSALVPEPITKAALVRHGVVEVIPPWSSRRKCRRRIAEVIITSKGISALTSVGVFVK